MKSGGEDALYNVRFSYKLSVVCISIINMSTFSFSPVCVLLYVKCLRFHRVIRCCFWPDLYKVLAPPVLLWRVTDLVQYYVRIQKYSVKSCNVMLYYPLVNLECAKTHLTLMFSELCMHKA